MNATAGLIWLIGGIILGTLGVYIYFQRKLSYHIQEKTLYQERASRLPELNASLLKREEELRLLGERNAELRTALQRTEKESNDKLVLLENVQKQWEDKFKTISSETLTMTNKSFLELANATLE